VVAICWRKLAMMDYTREEGDSGQKGQWNSVDYTLLAWGIRAASLIGWIEFFEFVTGLVDDADS